GIYVSIILFEGHAMQFAADAWYSHPFNITNNINNVDGDVNNDDQGTELNTLSSSASALALQEAYVHKVIDTVNDLNNVLYEICNESHGGSISWQNHMIDYVHAYEATKPKQHPVIFSTPLAQ